MLYLHGLELLQFALIEFGMPNPKQQEMIDWLKAHTQSYDYTVVFGSYARGEAYRSSDIDVLLIDSRFSGWSIHNEGLLGDWPDNFQDLQLITSAHEEFKTRYRNGDAMVAEIARDGYDIHSTFDFLDYVNDIDFNTEEK